MQFIYKEINKDNGISLRGVLNTPDNFNENYKYPTVIYFHGFADDRNGIQFMNIQNSKHLTSNGYIVYRFDFSGCGESDGSFYDITLTREIEEARLIHDFVAKESFVDTENLFWKGHSMGGAVAVVLAGEINPKALSLFSPAADFSKEENALMDKIKDAFKYTYREEGDDVGGLKIGKTFVEDVEKYDIYDFAKAYAGPVQILRGGEDDVISKESNLDLKEAFPDAIYEEIAGTNHNFSDFDQRLESFNKMYEFF